MDYRPAPRTDAVRPTGRRILVGMAAAGALALVYFAAWQPVRTWMVEGAAYPALRAIATERAARFEVEVRSVPPAVVIRGVGEEFAWAAPAGAYFLVPSLLLVGIAPHRPYWAFCGAFLVVVGTLGLGATAVGVGWADWGFALARFLDTYVARPASLAAPLLALTQSLRPTPARVARPPSPLAAREAGAEAPEAEAARRAPLVLWPPASRRSPMDHAAPAVAEPPPLSGSGGGGSPQVSAAGPALRVGIVSSCGGHLTEVRALRPAYAGYPHFYVLNDRALLPPDMVGRTYFITHSERDWRFLVNLVEAYRILRRERPHVLLSTGAGPIVPFALVGKLLFGTKVVFVETLARLEAPSLTGRLMYRLADHFFYPWSALERYFPRGIHSGLVI